MREIKLKRAEKRELTENARDLAYTQIHVTLLSYLRWGTRVQLPSRLVNTCTNLAYA